MRILEVVDGDQAKAFLREKHWIQHYATQGAPLLNIHFSGYSLPPSPAPFVGTIENDDILGIDKDDPLEQLLEQIGFNNFALGEGE